MSARQLCFQVPGVSIITPRIFFKVDLTVEKDRCLQTSMPTAKQLGLPIYVEQGVRSSRCTPIRY